MERWHLTLDDRPGVFDTLVPSQLEWWTPTLGPTATLLLPRLVRAAQSANAHGLFDRDGLAYQIGVKPAQAERSLMRLAMFRAVRIDAGPGPIVVRRYLPHLSPSHVLRAPAWWRAAYTAATGWVEPESVAS